MKRLYGWLLAVLVGCSSSDSASTSNSALVSIASYVRTPFCSRTGDVVTVTWSSQNADACSFSSVWIGADTTQTDALPTSGSLTTVVPNVQAIGYANVWCYRGAAVSWIQCTANAHRVDSGQGGSHWWSSAGASCGWAETFLVNTDAPTVAQQMGCTPTGTAGSGGSGGNSGTGGSTGNTCSKCLDSCRGLSGCCSGSGCICESAC